MSRSSNSPRYFAPATIAPRSSEISRLPRSDSGTSPATMRWARPSTTAVLPTPGSPISTGLFLVRRRQHLDDAADLGVAADDRVELALAGGCGEVDAVLLQRLEGALGVGRGDRGPSRAPTRARRPARRRGAVRLSTSATSPPVARARAAGARSETYSSPRSRASRSAAPSTASKRAGLAAGAPTGAPLADGSASTRRCSSARTGSGSTPTACSSGRVEALVVVEQGDAPGAPARRPGCRARRRSARRLDTACWLRVVRSMVESFLVLSSGR